MADIVVRATLEGIAIIRRFRSSDARLARKVDGQKLDAGFRDRLRIKLHPAHDLERHTDLDRQPDVARLASDQSIVVCPVAACELFRESLGGGCSIHGVIRRPRV